MHLTEANNHGLQRENKVIKVMLNPISYLRNRRVQNLVSVALYMFLD